VAHGHEAGDRVQRDLADLGTDRLQGRREADFDRWVELDLAYIDRWSIWLDFKIMAKTIPAMFQGR